MEETFEIHTNSPGFSSGMHPIPEGFIVQRVEIGLGRIGAYLAKQSKRMKTINDFNSWANNEIPSPNVQIQHV
jgi:hypothetical protein